MNFFIFNLLVSLSCNFQSGFEKALEDSKMASFGYNLDRFCYGVAEEHKDEFKKAYDLGQMKAPLFHELQIESRPQNPSEVNEIIERAQMRKVYEIEIKKLKEEISKIVPPPSSVPHTNQSEVGE